ncbi:hypothetical protein TH2_071 [Shewanella phage Thanatos-2]|nr:hypothetical protein TH2_071 [Shewanella phage Thanatos-2]
MTDKISKDQEIIKQAMSNVIQEMLIMLPDNTSHLVYILSLDMTSKGLKVEFNTLSEDRRDELAVHVEKCIMAQLEEITPKPKGIKKWLKLF